MTLYYTPIHPQTQAHTHSLMPHIVSPLSHPLTHSLFVERVGSEGGEEKERVKILEVRKRGQIGGDEEEA